MQQKLITFAVPCYNSAAYMRHCIETLLSAGEQAEIILVDDGSVKDDTPAICDEYAAKYPTIVKAIHQMCIRDSSFTVLYAIGHWVVFRVGGWSPRIPTRFHVSGRTLDPAQLSPFSPTWFSHSLTGLPMPFG